MIMDWTGSSYHAAHTKVVETREVSCARLDEIFDEPLLDFLKLDVEGAEMEVLRGSFALLKQKRVGVIKTEFVLFPYYEKHGVFGEQHAMLNKLGYRLIDIVLDKSTYSWEATGIPSYADRRMHYAGDAYFVLDPDLHLTDPLQSFRVGIVLMALGFLSLGLNLIQSTSILSEKEVELIERTVSKLSLKKLLLHHWYSLPSRLAKAVGR